MKRIRREYQKTALVAVRKVRQIALYWARRCRKSTTLGDIGFDEMSRESGRMVIAASASLLLGKELVGVTLSAAEQAMIVLNEAAAMRTVFETGAVEKGLNFQVADSGKDKILKGLTTEDFADLYQSSRMELRLYFDKTHFSRLQIIAPNPATARSWRAMVLRDECGYTPANFEQELRNATDPMMRDTPDLKIVYASNLSSNDRHPYFETTLPRDITAGTEDEQFPPNPAGHLYYGQHGILIHRVALKDAYASGHLLYDDLGKAMTYEECQKFPQFKSGWDATYALNHKPGGAGAIDLIALLTAQRRGMGQCSFVFVENEGDFHQAALLLRKNLRGGPVGVGFDVATTTAETSNPSSITFTENMGGERAQRLTVFWKERKPKVVWHRLRTLIEAVGAREHGGLPRRMCIDATSERYFAEETADQLRDLIPVQLVISSQSVDPRPTGYSDKDGEVNYKTYLGDLYCASVNDGRYLMAPDQLVKTTHTMVLKDAGRYVCVPDGDGNHGDGFDSGKLADYAVQGAGPFVFEKVELKGRQVTGLRGKGTAI